MPGNLGELAVSLGVDADTKKVNEFASAISSTTLKTVGLIGSLIGVSLEIKSMLTNTIDTATAMKGFESMGFDANKLQRWQITARMAGASAEGATSSILNLHNTIAKIKLGEMNPEPFSKLAGLSGINVLSDFDTDAFTLLTKTLNALRHVDKSFRLDLAQQLGVAELLPMLNKSNAELQAMYNTAGKEIMSDSQANKVMKVREELLKLHNEFTQMITDIVSTMSPEIASFFHILETDIKSIQELVHAYKDKGVKEMGRAVVIEGVKEENRQMNYKKSPLMEASKETFTMSWMQDLIGGLNRKSIDLFNLNSKRDLLGTKSSGIRTDAELETFFSNAFKNMIDITKILLPSVDGGNYAQNNKTTQQTNNVNINVKAEKVDKDNFGMIAAKPIIEAFHQIVGDR
jgi:hypothetical protein